VWKVTTATGNAGDLFVKRVYNDKWQQEEVVDDDAAKAANYIVRCADDVTPLKADGTALDTSHGYPVAHEGDRVLVTATNGNKVTAAYNGGVALTDKDADGNFYVTVPRGGGIDLTADIGDVPAHDPVAVPAGKTLTYNGKAQTGVEPGTGYTLSGTTSATNAGAYEATATLKAGYKWTDGTTAAKTVPWKINKANAKVTKALKKTYKVKALKKKAQKFTAVKLATDGKVTYKVTKKDAKKVLSFKKGKVTVKKGAKKGKYAMKVKVSAKAGKNYNVFKAKTYTIKVTVK
jgi:hypothetical protein